MKELEDKKILNTRNQETLKYVEKKLEQKGVRRLERHPSDGIPLRTPPRKSGRGGKYTWEGPGDPVENELAPSPPAIDEKDPNFVDEEEEDKIRREEDGEVEGLVIGEVEVPKAEKTGVARVDLDPKLATL